MRHRAADGIPTEVLRRAFDDSGLTAVQLAHALGWYRRQKGYVSVDGQRVRRALGLIPTKQRNGRTVVASMHHERAARFLRAMGLDPVDYGL